MAVRSPDSLTGEFAALLEELEVGVGADAMDAAGSDVAGDAEMADVGLVAHAVQLADGDVVALVVADTGERETGDGGEDDDGCGDDLHRALWFGVRHFQHPPPTLPDFAQSLQNRYFRLGLPV